MRTLKDLHDDYTELDRVIAKARRTLYKEREVIIKRTWPKYNPSKHQVGDDGWAWDCPTSPFGYCAYDMDEDPAWDACLFCGDPEERK